MQLQPQPVSVASSGLKPRHRTRPLTVYILLTLFKKIQSPWVTVASVFRHSRGILRVVAQESNHSKLWTEGKPVWWTEKEQVQDKKGKSYDEVWSSSLLLYQPHLVIYPLGSSPLINVLVSDPQMPFFLSKNSLVEVPCPDPSTHHEQITNITFPHSSR